MAEKKIAIIADIHGNLEAFKAVLADISKRGIQDIYCLGDIVGYGPNPDTLIALLQKLKSKLNFKCIFGNHDAAVAGRLPNYKQIFNHNAVIAVDWTIKQLSETDCFRCLLDMVMVAH